jgi:Transglutaminase-like superfamily
MRVVAEPVTESSLTYRYRNFGVAPVELWLACPPQCCVQDRVRVARQSREPMAILEVGGNRVAHYRVPPWQGLRVVWTFRRLQPALVEGATDPAPVLSPEDRSRYLEHSPQVPRHPLIDSQAQELAAGAEDAVAAARRFFRSLAADYCYGYPVRRRGALEMLLSRRGDCGQFASLFAALCRARGIPSRLLAGTHLTPWIDSAHVWAELWAEDIGWIPVDPSLGNAFAEAKRRGMAAPEPEQAFGRLPGPRFAFSVGFDLPLGERFGPAVRPPTLASLPGPHVSFGGRRLRWGFETLGGRVPYLQPAYPRCYAGKGVSTLWRCSLTGHWAVRAKLLPWTALGDVLAQAWLAIVLLLVGLGFALLRGPTWLADLLVGAAVALVGTGVAVKAALRGTLGRLLGRPRQS